MIARPSFPEWMMATGKYLPHWVIGAAAEKAGLGIADVDYITPHQAQWFTLNLWRATLEQEDGVPPSVWHEHFQTYGNMAGADAPLNLDLLVNGEGVEPGAIIAFFSPGGAGHSPAIILRAVQ
jgi:3-oxoacyl-[acyl-carrier-protein] synthase III